MNPIIKKITTNDGIYFPLYNEKGLVSSITPFLNGDLKLGYHHYALKPNSENDLYGFSTRNVIFKINGDNYYLNGQTERQQQDELTLETGLLYQNLERQSDLYSMHIFSFIPLQDTIERHRITLTNKSNEPFDVSVVTAVPLYGRSPDQLFDHRHVTSLLNVIYVDEQGILVRPTMSFDERGHQENHMVYSVCAQSDDLVIKGFNPVLNDFIKGGSLAFPKGAFDINEQKVIAGYDAIGAIQFEEVTLKPMESMTFYLQIGIHDTLESARSSARRQNKVSFDRDFKEVQQRFEYLTSYIHFNMTSEEVNQFLNWVSLQPVLRRHFGNSFLPHHDYGKGGKGWRDLWQDQIVLMMTDEPNVKSTLINNLAGVRIDGSNASIIGDRPGEFKADRNMIARIWSDHAAWPLVTIASYIDETGDVEFLLEKQTYFKDQFTSYVKEIVPFHQDLRLRNHQDDVYLGSVYEHLLLENIVGMYNLGKHGFVRLEDADWNDGLDMAKDQGETVAFTHMFTANIKKLADYALLMNQPIFIYEGLYDLIFKHGSLKTYFDEIKSFSGHQVSVHPKTLYQQLMNVYEKHITHLHDHGFIDGVFISHYDNHGENLDKDGHLSLAGQAMALLSQTATKEQAKSIAVITKDKLYDQSIGGYKLNTNHHQVLMQMGRAYGFAYGHKENGAVFSHMSIMYAYGLYQYDLIDDGHHAFMDIINQAIKDPSVHAGIPEYFNDRGKGMYPYLTGSASWLLKLLREEVFGIKMSLGKLQLKPKLLASDFIHYEATIDTIIKGRRVTITYVNEALLSYPNYHIAHMILNGHKIDTLPEDISGKLEVHLK